MSKSAEEILEESKAAMRLYFDSEKDRVKLLIVRQVTRIFSTSLKILVFACISIVGSIFLLTAAAMFWGAYLNNYPLAMLYVALCVFGIVIIFYFLRDKLITTPILRVFIKEMFKTDDD